MFGASKYKIEAVNDGELIDTRLELPGARKTQVAIDPIDRAAIRPRLWKGIEGPLASIFICVTLLLGGAGAGLETWWFQTGRYMAPEKRKSSRALQRLLDVTVVTKEEPKSVDPSAPPTPAVNIADLKPEPKPEAPAPGDTIIDMGGGEGDAISLAGVEPIDSTPDAELPAVGENVRTRIEREVARSFAVPVHRPSHRNHADRGRRAAFRLLDGSFGLDAGAFEPGTGRLSSARRDGSFGVGRMASGDDGHEVDLGAMADAEAGKGHGAHSSGHETLPAPFLLADADLPAAADMGKITRAAGDLDVKVGKGKKETSYKDFVLVRRLRHKSGGDLDKQAVFEIIRGKRGALGRCYRRHAKDNPYSSGKIEVRIRIDMTGRIKAKVISNSVEDPKLAACVVSKFHKWDVPAPSGKPVEVVVPLVFRSK